MVINSGSFFLRAGAWGIRFLRAWDDRCARTKRVRRREPKVAGSTTRRKFVWCAFQYQEVMAELDGFASVPWRARRAHRFFNGSAVGLPDARFNALLCTSLVRPAGTAAVLHVVRGRHSLGRCDPYYNPWRNFSKVNILGAVRGAGLQAGRAACCGDFQPLVSIAQRAGDDATALQPYRGFPKRKQEAAVLAAVQLLSGKHEGTQSESPH